MADFIGRSGARTLTCHAFLKHVLVADRHRVQREVRTSVTSGKRLTADFRITNPDGVVQWLYVAGSLNRGCSPEHLRAIARDVANR
jgi:hypothetical protein